LFLGFIIEEIQELSNAIQQDHVIEFKFKNKFYHAEPYRLVNFDGIWYLYGRDIEEKEGNDHKTWMLKHIDKVETYYGTKHDTTDEEIEEDLKNAHSPNFVIDKEFDITVKVSSKIADIFREKNHLPKQKSTLLSDGSLQITSTISTYADVDSEIKSWLPYIEIIEPLKYREKFLNELKEYLTSH
jgi:predicted DNA-binding transcriptional regulator YafY